MTADAEEADSLSATYVSDLTGFMVSAPRPEIVPTFRGFAGRDRALWSGETAFRTGAASQTGPLSLLAIVVVPFGNQLSLGT